MPATLAHHLGLKQLVDEHLDLGAKAGRANVGDKVMTLVMSALAGGDHIDHVDALRASGTGRALGFTVKAASTVGTFLRGFRWGHVRQHDLSRWTARVGLGEGIVTTRTLRRRFLGLPGRLTRSGTAGHAPHAGTLAVGGAVPRRPRAPAGHPHRGLSAAPPLPTPEGRAAACPVTIQQAPGDPSEARSTAIATFRRRDGRRSRRRRRRRCPIRPRPAGRRSPSVDPGS